MTGTTGTSEARAGGFLEEPLQLPHFHLAGRKVRFPEQRERSGNRRIRVVPFAAALENRVPCAREGQLEGRDFLQQLVPSRQIVGNDARAVLDLGRKVFQKQVLAACHLRPVACDRRASRDRDAGAAHRCLMKERHNGAAHAACVA